MKLPSLEPESSASANSAIPANVMSGFGGIPPHIPANVMSECGGIPPHIPANFVSGFGGILTHIPANFVSGFGGIPPHIPAYIHIRAYPRICLFANLANEDIIHYRILFVNPFFQKIQKTYMRGTGTGGVPVPDVLRLLRSARRARTLISRCGR